tara:strand:- start:650167 stop:651903 length:1737 start_codon:yes stop_codon:yes gene_type:complete
MKNSKLVISSFWCSLWAILLAIGWLLPNHYRPWMSFQSDAWVALTCLIGVVALLVRRKGPVPWHGLAILSAFLLFIVWAQYLCGLITMAGTAWVSSAYILGFMLALLAGARWEADSPSQLADALFVAIGLAAIISVGLQLHQWLGLDGLELLTMSFSTSRPYANFGQPNQLGTLLLWGVIAAAWGWTRRRIGNGVALLMAVYLLFGLALTGSRTAWIGVLILLVTSWLWRHCWRDKRMAWCMTGLAMYFFLCVVAVGRLKQLLDTAVGVVGANPLLADRVIQMSSNARLSAWRELIYAVWRHPWYGYGWNQTALAQMSVAENHPALSGVFTYSHNLFLDLLLWCGIPLGALISIGLLMWLWRRVSSVRNAECALLILFVLVIANHAMLELPLYFAYFLLPVGLAIGVLHVKLEVKPIINTGRWTFVVLWFLSAGLLGLIIKDYARIEPSYQTLRLEWDNFKMTQPVGPPEVLLLTQWREYVQYARLEPKAGLTTAEIEHLENVTALFPNIVFFNKLAMTLALNQRPKEAQLWLVRMSKVVPRKQYCEVKKSWERESLRNAAIAAAPWPIRDEDGFVCL